MRCPALLLMIAGSFLSPTISFGQNFDKVTEGFASVSDGNTFWVDLDNDGDLDLVLSGMVSFPSLYGVFVYENIDGDLELKETDLPDIRNGSISPGDFDGDGDFDMLLSGLTAGGSISALYENSGAFSFSLKYSFTPLLNSSTEWFDIDNDGDMDFLLAGEDENELVSKSFLFENTGIGFVQMTETGIPQFVAASVEPADINNDGKVDLLISGIQDGAGIHSFLFLNDGDKTFSIDPNSNLTHLFLGDVKASDADNDGDLDVFQSGVSMTSQVQSVFYENVNNMLVERPLANIAPVAESAGNAWFDVDTDNDLDIIVSGFESWSTFNPVMKIFINEGDRTFTEGDISVLEPTYKGSVATGDYDNDGDFDLSFLGRLDENGNNSAGIYRNSLTSGGGVFPNVPPNPPNAFSVRGFRHQVQLRSGAGADVETPVAALTYNFYLRDNVRRIVSPTSDVSTGKLLSLNIPNGYSRKITLSHAPEGNLFWAVQSIDGGNAASAFSAEQTFFHINGPEAVSIKFDDPRHIFFSWIDNSTVESQYVVSRSTFPTSGFSTVSTLPANTQQYTDEFDFETETYYYYKIFAKDGAHLSGYDSLAAVISEPPADLTATSVNASSISLAWDDMSNYELGYIIERKGPGQGTFSSIDTTSANAVTFLNSSLLEGSEYTFRVRALGEFGVSGYSNESTAVTNFRPLGIGFAIETPEDAPVIVDLFDENFSDPDAADQLNAIEIVRIPFNSSNGALKLEEIAVTEGQRIPLSGLDELVFNPAKDFNGEILFSFKYSDGKDYALNPDTVVIKILPVNDPPVISDIADIEVEGSTIIIDPIEFTVTDVDDSASAFVLSNATTNESLVDNIEIESGVQPGSYSLHIAVADETSGEGFIRIIASDGELSDSVTFTLSVSLITGLAERVSGYSFYPNPFSNRARVVFPITEGYLSLTIKDQFGRTVFTCPVYKRETDLDLSFLPPGVFFLEHVTARSRGYFKMVKESGH